MKLTQPPSKSAFTLVELLVVIGVIATLLSLLLGSVAGARRAANSIKCASNLRQIGIICNEYFSDWNGKLPNNSYALGDNPVSLVFPPQASVQAIAAAQTRGNTSTSNYEWFDAVAAYSGWKRHRTVASRYCTGESDLFRQTLQILWCPDVDQSVLDPAIFATNYGICLNVSAACGTIVHPPPPKTDGTTFNFLNTLIIRRASDVVFLNECSFYNQNGDAYGATNGSMANVSHWGATTMPGRVRHQCLNYLFFDSHVSQEIRPPHSMGSEFGVFYTTDNYQYTITAGDNTAFLNMLAAR